MAGANDGLELVLASGSPRRRQLLAEAGIPFTVVAPMLAEPEDLFNRLPPMQQAEALAYFKARFVAGSRPNALILGADTIVALGAAIMGKPADDRHAREMLTALSGTRHVVVTGLALLAADGRRLIASDVTYITMRAIEPREIDAYVASGEWIGKAGAYAIQETADKFVERLEGSFTNVVGLPMELLGRMMKEFHERLPAR